MSRKPAPKRASSHPPRAAKRGSAPKSSAGAARAAKRGEQPSRGEAGAARGPGRPSQGADAERNYPPTARVIKRYGNRRLYDAKLSRCVTMAEIADMVREREDVRVVDGENGEDLTKRMLVQIILEQQNAANLELLPVELLHQLISVRSQPVAGWLEQYLQAGAEFLERQSKAAGPTVRTATDAFGNIFPWLNPESWKGAPGTEPPAHAPAAAPAQKEPEPALRQELAELQRRFAELNARLGRV